MSKLVHGKGTNDVPSHILRSGEERAHFYGAWTGMLQRCYDPKYHAKRPTYIGCTVCEKWLILSNFVEWYDVNYVEGFQLDKDLLVEGNKVYPPETCVYVSPQLNTILNDCGTGGSVLPIGVTFDKSRNKYRTQIRAFGERRNLGRFDTPEEASKVYQKAKTEHVLEVIEKRRGVDSDRILDILQKRFEEKR